MKTNFYENTEQAVSYLPNADDVNTVSYLREFLKPLNKIEDGCAELALAYLLTGVSDEVTSILITLTNTKITEAMNDWSYKPTEKFRLFNLSSVRYKLSANIFETLHTKQLIRFGIILACITRLPNFARFYDDIPIWFVHLLDDAVHLPAIKLLDLVHLLNAEHVNHPEKVIAQLILDSRDNPRRRDGLYGFRLDGIEKVADFETFYKDNIHHFESCISGLTERGQKDFFDYILSKHPNLLQISHHIITTLCVSEYDEPRKKAMEKIVRFEPDKVQSHLFELYQSGNENQRSYAIEALIQTGQSSVELLEKALTSETEDTVISQIKVALNRLSAMDDTISYINFNENISKNDVIQLLDNHLVTLDELASGLSSLALQYVVKGEDEITEKLLKKRQESVEKNNQSRMAKGNLKKGWRLVYFKESVQKKLFQQLFQVLTNEQVIRLAKLYECLQVFSNECEYQQPKWFYALVNDGLEKTVFSQYDVSERPDWTYQNLKRLLDIENIESPETILVDLLLGCREINRWDSFQVHNMYILHDAKEFIEEHALLIEESIPHRSAKEQQVFFDTFSDKFPTFIPNHLKCLAWLCVSDYKAVRDHIATRITDVNTEKLQIALQTILKTGNAKQKALAVDALVTTGDTCLPILEQALAEEKTKSVQTKLEQAIQRLSMLQANKQEVYEIPEFVPLEITKIPDSFMDVMKQNALEIYKSHKNEYELLVEEDTCDYSIKQAKKKTKDWKAMAEGTDVYQFMLDKLNGKPAKLSAQGNNATGWKANDVWINDIVSYKNSIQKQSGYGLLQALIASDLRYGYSWRSLEPLLTKKMLETLELRQLYQVLQSLKLTKEGIERDNLRDIASVYLCRKSDAFFTTEQLVPFFTTHPELLAEALGLAPLKHGYNFKFENALDVLTLFPQIPDQYIPKLLEVALGTQKKLRFECQEVLSNVPNIHLQAIDALKNSKAEIRITATDWLGRLGKTQEQHRVDIITALHTVMKKEKKEAVTTAVLSALEKNGDDISLFLSPEVLLKEAQKGQKAKLSKTFTWFNESAIPSLSWQDGSEVDSQIIHWWIVLAEKLKEPKPNALFKRYLNLLNEASQQSLSLFVLQTFEHHDLDLYSKTEAIDIATKLAPRLHGEYGEYGFIFSNDYGVYDSWSKQYPDMPITTDIIHTHVVAQLQKAVKSSAIKSKGMLALVHKAVGTSAVDILTNYIKNHHRRTAQISALLDAFSASDDPLVIQWILNISRRYRTKSIQEKAMDIIAEIAKRNHWTPAQLGDRTIPMAGVDDDGILQLDYGTRMLTAYIDEKYKFVLQNEQGKVIKSLPAPRQEDDKKLIKETKSLFSACKKELKQMIELQTARLYEAMCCERIWAVAEWQEYLLAHPIMKRLIARLIWLEVDAEGTILQVFRPSEDGSLLNITDDEIILNPDSQIKLAHHVLLENTSHDVKQWKQHLKDYEIKPLFEQLKHTVPQINDDENSFTDFVDTPSEAFKLRSVVTKLGYLRCGIGDGGGFDKYYKYYESLDISAVLVFSGSGVPEENINIQLGEFRFQKGRVHTWDREGIDFVDVPPILLAESYAEYGLIAKKI